MRPFLEDWMYGGLGDPLLQFIVLGAGGAAPAILTHSPSVLSDNS